MSEHWREYASEGALLGLFMFVACLVVRCVQHPDARLRRIVGSEVGRRWIVGAAMGLTAVMLIRSPLGRLSGAHMNPATTLTFVLLGKVAAEDAAWYVVAQFAGGLLGVLAARGLLGAAVAHESVRFAATIPGRRGAGVALLGELSISFAMMSMVLWSSNHASTAPYTSVFAGVLVTLFIRYEAPLSGMSMNPARTLASALPARRLTALWVYFVGPAAGMLAAAIVHVKVVGGEVFCAKLDHGGIAACIFDCEIDRMRANPD